MTKRIRSAQHDAYQEAYQAIRRAQYRHRRDLTPHPAPDEIRDARLRVNLTQDEAGAIVYTTGTHWSNWERGVSKMPKASWRLFCLLVGLETLPAISDRFHTQTLSETL